MELKYDDIQQLIAIEKCVDESILSDGVLTLSMDFPVQKEIRLFSLIGDVEFRWVINQSSKVSFKVTLFVMERENNLGLLRVDYVPDSKIHYNPQIGETVVPEYLTKYAGQEIRGNHIHFAVPGYKDLIWAMPLSDAQIFPEMFKGDQPSLCSIIDSFANKINLSTKIIYEVPVI